MTRRCAPACAAAPARGWLPPATVEAQTALRFDVVDSQIRESRRPWPKAEQDNLGVVVQAQALPASGRSPAWAQARPSNGWPGHPWAHDSLVRQGAASRQFADQDRTALETAKAVGDAQQRQGEAARAPWRWPPPPGLNPPSARPACRPWVGPAPARPSPGCWPQKSDVRQCQGAEQQ